MRYLKALIFVPIALLAMSAAPSVNSSTQGCEIDASAFSSDGEFKAAKLGSVTAHYHPNGKLHRLYDSKANVQAIFFYRGEGVSFRQILTSKLNKQGTPVRYVEYDHFSGKLLTVSTYKSLGGFWREVRFPVGGGTSSAEPSIHDLAGNYVDVPESAKSKVPTSITFEEPLNSLAQNCFSFGGQSFPLRWSAHSTSSSVSAPIKTSQESSSRLSDDQPQKAQKTSPTPDDLKMKWKGNTLEIEGLGSVQVEGGPEKDEDSETTESD